MALNVWVVCQVVDVLIVHLAGNDCIEFPLFVWIHLHRDLLASVVVAVRAFQTRSHCGCVSGGIAAFL